MSPTVPSPSDIVHDVALFLLNPPHPEAIGREMWDRARDTIAKLATEPSAVATPATNVVSLTAFRATSTRPNHDPAA